MLLKNKMVRRHMIFFRKVPLKKVDVLFFAGCMTHLTPAILKSMIKILDASGLKYKFIDEKGGVCCRPAAYASRAG